MFTIRIYYGPIKKKFWKKKECHYVAIDKNGSIYAAESPMDSSSFYMPDVTKDELINLFKSFAIEYAKYKQEEEERNHKNKLNEFRIFLNEVKEQDRNFPYSLFIN